MSIDRILVGTDFSAEAEVALAHAMNIARRVEAEVVLLHATTVPEPQVYVPGAGPSNASAQFNQIFRAHLAESRERLERLRELHSGQGVTLSHAVLDAFPDVAIATAMRELPADLAVIGTHGRTGFRRFLLGSVAERAVRIVDANIMVARPPAAGAGGYKRILVPTDYSTAAEQALQQALTLVAPGGSIELFNAWQLPTASTSYWGPAGIGDATMEPLRSELAETSRALGGALLAKYRDHGAKLTFDNAEDTAGHGIQEHLQRGHYELVCMGSHGRRGIRRWLLGSVAEVTVRYSPCSVLVVHAGASQT